MKPSPLDHPDASGELYWGGVAGTQWWISPKRNMAGVMMAQRQMAFVHPFSFEFKRLAYEAVKQGRGENARVRIRTVITREVVLPAYAAVATTRLRPSCLAR